MRKSWLPIMSAFFIAGLLSSAPFFQLTQAQQQSTGSYSDDFSEDSGSWQYLGSAYREQTNQCLVLTDSGHTKGGVAFFHAPIPDAFTANFSYKVGEGDYQGDGFTMFFFKQEYSPTDNGGSLSFNHKYEIIPGYGIEFDAWQNIPQDFQSVVGGQQNPQGDPSNNHIALIEDFTGNHLAYVNDPRVSDNNWHNVSVIVQASAVKVFVDQGLVLQWSGKLNRTYAGFGFSGANGQVGSNWHIIDNFSITSSNLQKSALTTSCQGSVSGSNFNAKISGTLTFNGTVISGVPILLSYSVTGGKSWQDLTFVNTGSDGSFSALWLPSVTGNYLIKAVYEGDENYLGAVNVINFAMEPCAEQSVFSVTSNSTISELSFNSAKKEMSFSVSGDEGTTGYVDVYIPKSLISDIEGLKVYLDSSQIEYAAESQSDCWLLYFTYHHSMHSVVVSMGSLGTLPSQQPSSTIIPTEQPIAVPTQTGGPMSFVEDVFPLVLSGVAVGVSVATLGLLIYLVRHNKSKQ